MSYRETGNDDNKNATVKSLHREIAALRHELRRVQDGLERGRSPQLERRARQLRNNIALCERELEAGLSAPSGGE